MQDLPIRQHIYRWLMFFRSGSKEYTAQVRFRTARMEEKHHVKIDDRLFLIPIAFERNGQINTFNASLLLDQVNGPMLIDTGLPGQHGIIDAALAEAGVGIADLKAVLLTHQDIDHIGSLNDIVTATGATVFAGADEVRYIDGTEPPRFARPEILEQRPEMRALVARFTPTLVDQPLADGTVLDIAGGVQVVFSPGHTPGHICLFHEPSGTLIAGDALTADNGTLHGPNAGATSDMITANRSVQRLAELPVQRIICYHGGLVSDDAAGQLRQVAAEAAG